jgi:hypothetical protein
MNGEDRSFETALDEVVKDCGADAAAGARRADHRDRARPEHGLQAVGARRRDARAAE